MKCRDPQCSSVGLAGPMRVSHSSPTSEDFEVVDALNEADLKSKFLDMGRLSAKEGVESTRD